MILFRCCMSVFRRIQSFGELKFLLISKCRIFCVRVCIFKNSQFPPLRPLSDPPQKLSLSSSTGFTILNWLPEINLSVTTKRLTCSFRWKPLRGVTKKPLRGVTKSRPAHRCHLCKKEFQNRNRMLKHLNFCQRRKFKYE
jgi:hypothetical protein